MNEGDWELDPQKYSQTILILEKIYLLFLINVVGNQYEKLNL